MRLSVWGFIILANACVALLPARANADAGRDSGTTDASRDASSGGAGGADGSGVDGRAGSSGDGSAGRGDSAGPTHDTGAPDADASHPLVGTSAIACGPPAGTLNPELLTSCTDVCPFGSCVPASEVSTQAADFPSCADPAYRCMPRFLIETLGKVRFKSCHSVGSVEGRCIPQCLPIIRGQPLPLPQDDCLASERCLPCFSPIDGRDTGVCNYQCDPGPTHEPVVFPGCCGTEGVCLSADLIPAQDKARLRQESCGANSLCAPKDPFTPSFSCEVRGSEPSPGTGGSGTGGSRGGSGGSKSKPDGGNAAPARAADDSGCGCRVARNDHENITPWLALLGAAAFMRRRRVIR